MKRWLAAPAGASLTGIWGKRRDAIDVTFAAFTRGILRHLRIHPAEVGLPAVNVSVRQVREGARVEIRRAEPDPRRQFDHILAGLLELADVLACQGCGQ